MPANALPCDRFDMDRRCVNGRITECDVAVGYRLERSCEVGFLCVGDGTNARCDDIRTLNCQENVWSPICVDDTLYVCRENRVVSQDRCG